MINEQDYDGDETLYLMSSAKNHEELMQSIKEADNNEFVEVELS